jgi:hypothetical protein
MVGNHYEVRVDGRWVPVHKDKIIHAVAPDGGLMYALRIR